MKISQELMTKANLMPRLILGKKEIGESGKESTHSTGPHHVKIIEDKLQTGKDKETGKPIPIVRYIFEEKGEKKQYDVPVKDKAGELHYLIQQLSQYSEGQELIIEMKRKGIKNYISVTPIGNGVEVEADEMPEDLPNVEYPEDDANPPLKNS